MVKGRIGRFFPAHLLLAHTFFASQQRLKHEAHDGRCRIKRGIAVKHRIKKMKVFLFRLIYKMFYADVK